MKFLLKAAVLGSLFMGVSCGSDHNDKNNAPEGSGAPNPPEGRDSSRGDKGDPGENGEDGKSYERTLNGIYAGSEYHLQLSEAAYQKAYDLEGRVFLESGVSLDQKQRIVFQPKLYSCQSSEEVRSYTDRDIAEQVNLYRDDLIIRAKDDLEGFYQEKDDLPGAIDQARGGVEQAQAQVAEAQARYDEQAQLVQSVQQEISVLSENHERMRQHKEALSAILSKNEKQAADLGAQHEVAMTKVADLTKQIEAKDVEVTTKVEELAEKKKDLEDAAAEVAAVAIAIKRLEAEKVALSGEIIRLRDQIAVTTDEEMKAILLGELNLIEEEYVSLDQRQKDLEATRQTLQASVNKLTKEKSSLSVSLSETRKARSKLVRARTSLRKRASGIQKRLMVTLDEGESLRKEIEKTELERSRMEILIGEKGVELENASTRLSELETDLKERKDLLVDALRAQQSLEDRFADMDRVIEEQVQAVANMEATDIYTVKDLIADYTLNKKGLALSSGSKVWNLKRVSSMPEDAPLVDCMDGFALLFGALNTQP